MFITYKPEGSEDGRTWEFDARRIRSSRSEMIERRFSQLSGQRSATWDQFKVAIQQGSASARRVLLWHLMDLDHPGKVRIEDVDPYEEEITVEYSRDELEDLLLAVQKTPGISEAELAIIVAKLDEEILTAPEGSRGKAPSPTSGPVTG